MRRFATNIGEKCYFCNKKKRNELCENVNRNGYKSL